MLISEPEMESAGGMTTSVAQTTYSSGGGGVGIAYYIMPMNLQVGGALLLTSNDFSYDDEDDETINVNIHDPEEPESGVGANFNVTKEWFVSPQWGIGVNGQLYFSRNDDLNTFGLGVNFAATFN
jgi:hypothetical protein